MQAQRSQPDGLYCRQLTTLVTRHRGSAGGLGAASQVVCIAGRLQGRGGRSGAASQVVSTTVRLQGRRGRSGEASQVVSTTVRLQGRRGRSSQPSWQYVLFCLFFFPSQMQQHRQARRQTQQHGKHQIAGVRAVWAAPLVRPQSQHVRQRNIAGKFVAGAA